MSIGRFIILVIVIYIAYSILYISTAVVIFADVFAVNNHVYRDLNDPLVLYVYLGNLTQTIIFVLLFEKAVGRADVKAGAMYGFLFGVFIAGKDTTFYFGNKVSTDPWLLSIVLHLCIGLVVGALLAKAYGMGREREMIEP